MSYWPLWIVLAAGLAVGCQKQGTGSGDPGTASDASGDTAVPASPRGLGQLSEVSTNAAVIADTGDVNATLQQLTLALRDYVVRTRSVPKNFEDFAAKAQVQFPPAPDGKKYAIKDQAVVLVNR